jgi:transposase
VATKRLPMRKAKEVLRLKWDLQRSHRDVCRSLGVSVGAVTGALARAKAAGFDWPAVRELSEEALEAALYKRLEGVPVQAARPPPDCAAIEAERHKPGVTLALLHQEYREQHPDGYGYTQFCEYYRRWASTRGLTMRMEHKAGDKLFVDYSGKQPRVVDPETGEERAVELFVAVLGASSFTYAEATETQRVADFVASHIRAFEYFEGVPAALVPDRLKSAVIGGSSYEPTLQRTYEDLAEHYGTSVLPARARKPRDKAKVEVGVQVAQRWILARIRKERFFSVDALNVRIRGLVDELNLRVMRRYGASRRERFERIDRPALRPLPPSRYTLATWSKAKVGTDYHVEVDKHAYSVPHRLVGQQVEVRTTLTTVEVLKRGERVVVHVRSFERGGRTTKSEHLPVAHRKHLEWTPERIGHWAASVGPWTVALTEAILRERPHPEAGYRSCLGLMRLESRYGADRLERASRRAHNANALSYTHVERMLRAHLDRLEPAGPVVEESPITHENVRGPAYYN